MGKPLTVKETVSSKDDDTRTCKMEFKGAEGTSYMEINYTRKK
jgi:hypothetical protein